MELELTQEQTWLAESASALLAREWAPPGEAAPAGPDQAAARAAATWAALAALGATTVGGPDGLRAVELCVLAREIGAHLAPVPFLGTAAVRLALAPAPAGPALPGADAIAVALLEPGSGWSAARPRTRLAREPEGQQIYGEKVAIEQLAAVSLIAVVATGESGPALAFCDAGAPGLKSSPQACFDPAIAMAVAAFEAVPALAVIEGDQAEAALARLMLAGALLSAAEATGAAGQVLDLACRYAGVRRQFGRPIGSFQAIRHLLADAYVRHASSWSAVLCAAAAFDEGGDEAAQAISVAKAYTARAARSVAHDAMQVFGGIAFTAEHPAHRFLRRIVVRERQFGDAVHHERLLGETLASRARGAAA